MLVGGAIAMHACSDEATIRRVLVQCARTGQNEFGLLSLNLCMAMCACTTVRF